MALTLSCNPGLDLFGSRKPEASGASGLVSVGFLHRPASRFGLAAMFLIAASAVPAPAQTVTCSNGGAVDDPTNNAALVADCDALLEGKATLYPNDILNWSATRSITSWRGITVSDGRVTKLELSFHPVFRLQGQLPSELGELTALTELSLVAQEMSGPIPAALGNLRKLRVLEVQNSIGDRLNRRYLTGPLPMALWQLTELRKLSLDDNRLTGTLPEELGMLSKLKVLRLKNNELSGEIPMALGSLSDLEEIVLNGNDLSGPIPASLATGVARMASIRLLSLAANQLTGCIPKQFEAIIPRSGNPGTLNVHNQQGEDLKECKLTAANAGEGRMVHPNEEIMLQGSFTGDVLPDAVVRYTWAADMENSDATDAMLSATDTAGPIFTVPADLAEGQSFIFQLTVSGAESASGEETATVTFTAVALALVLSASDTSITEAGNTSQVTVRISRV